ncbi:hypothetical protein [Nocardia sp. NPDC004260]
MIDFGDLFAGDPAFDLAAAWILLPDGATDRFHDAYQSSMDTATLRRARGWAVLRAFAGIFIADAGVHGRPGGKPTWGPPPPGRTATPHRHPSLTSRLQETVTNSAGFE